MSLSTALADGRNIYLMDGIYSQDTVTLRSGVTMLPATGARPVIVHSDGEAPAVILGNGCTLSGIWFGGVNGSTDRAFQLGDNCRVISNTFFNWYEVVAEGGHTRNIYQNNRFVNCGTGSLYHDMYISEGHAVDACLIQGNIHIGGQGYKSHLFNSVNGAYPSNVKLLNNFYGDVQWGQAIYGTGHSVTKNIIWSVTGIIATLAGSDFTWSQNVIGLDTTTRLFMHPENNQTEDGNCFVSGSVALSYPDYRGTNPVVWQESDVVANLGNSSTNIDAAIAALESAFTQTVQQIHDDSTIETHFATIKAVIDTWKTK